MHESFTFIYPILNKVCTILLLRGKIFFMRISYGCCGYMSCT